MTKRRKKRYVSPTVHKVPLVLSGIILFVGLIVLILSLRGLVNQESIHQDSAGEPITRQAFIDELVPVAKEMHATYGVLPSIIIGQAILESDWGTSELSATYHNLFGMKSFDPNEESVNLATKEYKEGKWIDIQAPFKVYRSWDDSVRDHTQLFLKGVDWDPYLYQGVLLADNYETAATSLQVAGYATDPGYAKKLIALIEEQELYQYD